MYALPVCTFSDPVIRNRHRAVIVKVLEGFCLLASATSVT